MRVHVSRVVALCSLSATLMPCPDRAEEDCPECREQKSEAEAKAKATPEASDGLRLGNCAPLYDAWAECIDREKGQAKACTLVLKEFKECHERGAALARTLLPAQR